MNAVNKENIGLKLALLFSGILYFVFAYVIKRDDTILLFSTIGLLFVFYFYVLRKSVISERLFLFLIVSAFGFRFIFMMSTPALSDDFYRFIWDGRLINSGINPFAYLPDYIHNNALLNGTENNELFNKMNSPHYFSVYPPVLQGVFFISAKLSFNNNFVAVILLRLFILISEVGTCYFLMKIISHFKLPKPNVLVYILNPLVIIELSGNLHFEAIMLFFITASVYFLIINKLIYSALFFALAVSTKMIPLILLPLFVKSIGFKKGFVYSVIVFVITVILFLPFIDKQLVANIANSVGLYFQKFEFNASFYYLIRWLGFQVSGYNEIALIGKILPIVSFIFILIISFKNSVKEIDHGFFYKILQILFIYYLCALIVHPWYVSFLILISVFSNARFAIIWSLLIFGSYITYATLPYYENTLLLWIEYAVVLAWFFLEKKKLKLVDLT